MDTTVAVAVQRIGETFCSFHDLFIWMDFLGGDDFKTQVRDIHFRIDTIPSSREYQRGIQATRDILELHSSGLSLLKYAKPYQQSNALNFDWNGAVNLSKEHLREWEESLRLIVSGLRYVEFKSFL